MTKKLTCDFCKRPNAERFDFIDCDKGNTGKDNAGKLCPHCRHTFIVRYRNPLLRRVFVLLRFNRYSFEDIGQIFSLTRQGAAKLINKK